MKLSVRGNLLAPVTKGRASYIITRDRTSPLNLPPFQLSLGATRERGVGGQGKEREIKVYAILPATQKQHLNIYREQHIYPNLQ